MFFFSLRFDLAFECMLFSIPFDLAYESMFFFRYHLTWRKEPFFFFITI